jgi:hypothetical protein
MAIPDPRKLSQFFLNNMSMVTYGGPIKKYVQTTPSADENSSFLCSIDPNGH